LSRISCIMPTRDRGEFVAQAVRYFLRQDYPDKELVVVDDGEEPVRSLLPTDAAITYIRLESRTPLGAKRNIACEAARGTHIAHWDDDDWCAPERLSHQMVALRQRGAAVSGARDMLHYVPLTGEAWMYRRPAGDPPSFCGGSLLYEREAWQRNPFQSVDVGEDEAFMRGVPAARQAPIDASSLYVAVLHRGWPSIWRWGWWKPVPDCPCSPWRWTRPGWPPPHAHCWPASPLPCHAGPCCTSPARARSWSGMPARRTCSSPPCGKPACCHRAGRPR
jgi:glycosyltransferase involved in cell wall biosynthesis